MTDSGGPIQKCKQYDDTPESGEGGHAMKAETRIFGTIDIEDSKIIKMEKGMIGFPDLRKFTLIFDKEKAVRQLCGFNQWMMEI